MSGTREVLGERRKVMLGMIPYILDTFTQTVGIVSPAALMLQALHRYDRRIMDKEAKIRSALVGLREVEMSVSGRHILLFFRQEEVVELLRLYLTLENEITTTEGLILPVGSASSPAMFDYELRLPDRSIYVAMLDYDDPSEDDLKDYVRFICRADVPDVWLLTPRQGREVLLQSEPVFRENGVRRGRLRTMALPRLLQRTLRTDRPVAVSRSREGYVFTIDYG